MYRLALASLFLGGCLGFGSASVDVCVSRSVVLPPGPYTALGVHAESTGAVAAVPSDLTVAVNFLGGAISSEIGDLDFIDTLRMSIGGDDRLELADYDRAGITGVNLIPASHIDRDISAYVFPPAGQEERVALDMTGRFPDQLVELKLSLCFRTILSGSAGGDPTKDPKGDM